MLLFVVWAPAAMAARPKVLVKVTVDVPAYTERWQKLGKLTALEEKLLSRTKPLLETKFAFVDWLERGATDAQLLITLQETRSSPRKEGLRPWVFRPVLTMQTEVRRAPDVPFFDADKVGTFLPKNDLDEAARNLVDRVAVVLNRELDNEAWPKTFVEKILSGLPVATGIEAYASGAVLIDAPCKDLRATDKSLLHASFDGAPPRLPVRRVLLYLAPTAERGVKTEGALQPPPSSGWARDGIPPLELPQYIRNPRVDDTSDSVAVRMIVYDPLSGRCKSGDTVVP
ncbi:MAG: hypothetical protein ACXW5U_28230 [Thermoanaerobaculia bacterium]